MILNDWPAAAWAARPCNRERPGLEKICKALDVDLPRTSRKKINARPTWRLSASLGLEAKNRKRTQLPHFGQEQKSPNALDGDFINCPPTAWTRHMNACTVYLYCKPVHSMHGARRNGAKVMSRTNEQAATFFERPFRTQETKAPDGVGLDLKVPCAYLECLHIYR